MLFYNISPCRSVISVGWYLLAETSMYQHMMLDILVFLRLQPLNFISLHG
ncbi:hypothetical protein C3B55_00108 [Candidatus Pseudomonas adelgestsugas]|uniref:Uncharacterized protein n=1 Tax=Candidatus Pseudomonas adelgestsugas TaxID=1302376 RepID=A0ABX5R7Z6_9PSED|nr:hypothetical protein C3B55_00108 [Candidatus Pseudomonas adelgestsugas]